MIGIFEDSEVTHVMDSIDPVRDLEIIQEELILKDIAMVSAEVAKLEKVVQREKHRKPELVCLFFFLLFYNLFYCLLLVFFIYCCLNCRRLTRSVRIS